MENPEGTSLEGLAFAGNPQRGPLPSRVVMLLVLYERFSRITRLFVHSGVERNLPIGRFLNGGFAQYSSFEESYPPLSLLLGHI